MNKLSVVLATRNEGKNLGSCLESVTGIADEIIVVDEYSTDNTVEIAKKYGAKVVNEPHHEIFHITKQKALESASLDWILQLDADEEVPRELAREIKETINLPNEKLEQLRAENLKNDLFKKHQRLIEQRDGPIGKKTGEIVGFFIPRVNNFLGKALMHSGVYPDPSIRLVKRGMAHFSGKSVHDIMQLDGEVSWLKNHINHNDSPTLSKYLKRFNRYTDLHSKELSIKRAPKNIPYAAYYSLILPLIVFLKLFIRHKGFLDGARGFLWSFLSALHYPISYFKYLTKRP